jgi:hypothetical protein
VVLVRTLEGGHPQLAGGRPGQRTADRRRRVVEMRGETARRDVEKTGRGETEQPGRRRRLVAAPRDARLIRAPLPAPQQFARGDAGG